MSTDERRRCCAIGLVPNTPIVYWDYDLNNESESDAISWLKNYATAYREDSDHTHYAIRKTKHGLHLVMQVRTWDAADFTLRELKNLTDKVSIMSCRKQRIRISPKWELKTGFVLSPAPYVIDGCPHTETWYADITDKSKGRLEYYETYEHTVDTKQWTPQMLYLESRKERIA